MSFKGIRPGYKKLIPIPPNLNFSSKKLFQNLFNGDPELTETMNKFINENWRIMTAEIRPTIEAKLSDIVREVADRIFDKYPLEKLLE